MRVMHTLEALGPGWTYSARKQAFLGPGTMFVRRVGKKQRLNYNYSFFNNYKHVSNHRELYKLQEAIAKVVKDEGLVIPPASNSVGNDATKQKLKLPPLPPITEYETQAREALLRNSIIPTNETPAADRPKISEETKEKVKALLNDAAKNRKRITLPRGEK